MTPIPCFIQIYYAIDSRSATKSGNCMLISNGRPTNNFVLTGQSHILTLALPTGTPIGILFDRLEEHPEEVEGASPEQVSAMVAYLRTQYPNGV